MFVELDQTYDVLHKLVGNSSLRSTPAATADATAGSRWGVAYLFQISREVS